MSAIRTPRIERGSQVEFHAQEQTTRPDRHPSRSRTLGTLLSVSTQLEGE